MKLYVQKIILQIKSIYQLPMFSKFFIFQLFCLLVLPFGAVAQLTATHEGINRIDSLLAVPKSLNFLVIGDWGRNGYFHQQDVADRMNEAAYQNEAAFIVSTGDNFYINGVASVDDPLWLSSFENIYKGSELQRDWFAVLGNHDYHGSVQAQIDYSKKSRRWRMLDRFYKVERTLRDGSGEKILLLFIDSNPFQPAYTPVGYPDIAACDTAQQKAWIKNTLSKSNAKWKIVVGHHPLYSGGVRKGKTQDMATAFEHLFETYKVDAYFCGHEHDLQHIRLKHTHQFLSGAGSEVRPTGSTEGTLFSASVQGFMAVSATKEQLLVQVVDYKGNVLYRATLKK